MKNVQIIDGAMNATYSFFQCDDQQFELIFPMKDQNILFIGDLAELECKEKFEEIDAAIGKLWSKPVRHEAVCGVHGTIFYEKENCKQYYPKSRRWADMAPSSFNEFQRKMYAED